MFRLSNAAKTLRKNSKWTWHKRSLDYRSTCDDRLIQDQILALLKREVLSDGQINFHRTIGILGSVI